MTKFCGNCGAEIAENSGFCHNCGTPCNQNYSAQVAYNSPEVSTNGSGAKSNKKKGIVGIVAIVAIVLVVALVLVFGGGNSYKKVIGTYIESSYEDPDAATIISLFPEEMFTYLMLEEDMTRSEAVNDLQEELDEYVEYLNKRCDDLSISWDIIDEVDATKSEVKFLSGDLEDMFNLKVSAKKDVTVELIVDAVVDGESMSRSEEIEVSLIKSGNSWYLWGVNGSTFEEMF